jgi:hypothetical protein
LEIKGQINAFKIWISSNIMERQAERVGETRYVYWVLVEKPARKNIKMDL